MSMVEVKVEELSGAALDWAVMTLKGFALVRVGYIGLGPEEDTEFNESPEQANLPEWFKEATDNSVGAYWLRESDMSLFNAFWPHYETPHVEPASPSTDWSQGGPLIDDYQIWLSGPINLRSEWNASLDTSCESIGGRNALEAICRAIVAAKLGPTVSVPAELVTP